MKHVICAHGVAPHPVISLHVLLSSTADGTTFRTMSDLERRQLDLTAHQIYAALEALRFDVSQPEQLVQALRQIDVGLPAEDEFAATLVWMGRVKFVHMLRQSQAPRSSLKSYRIPDLLAVFDHRGAELTALIQVKSTYQPYLRWSAAYYERQLRYASLLQLPLLVAWQWRQFGAWTLFDSSRLADGKRIHFGEALKHTLMSELAGDFWVRFRAGVGVHFVADVIEHGDTHAPPALGEHGLLEPGPYFMRIREAYVTDGKGHRSERLDPPGLWPFLLTSPTLKHESHFDGLAVTVSFVIREDENEMAMGQRLLPLLLEYMNTRDVHWRSVLAREAFPVPFEELREAVVRGIQTGFVHIVADVEPHTLPPYLGRTK